MMGDGDAGRNIVVYFPVWSKLLGWLGELCGFQPRATIWEEAVCSFPPLSRFPSLYRPEEDRILPIQRSRTSNQQVRTLYQGIRPLIFLCGGRWCKVVVKLEVEIGRRDKGPRIHVIVGQFAVLSGDQNQFLDEVYLRTTLSEKYKQNMNQSGRTWLIAHKWLGYFYCVNAVLCCMKPNVIFLFTGWCCHTITIGTAHFIILVHSIPTRFWTYHSLFRRSLIPLSSQKNVFINMTSPATIHLPSVHPSCCRGWTRSTRTTTRRRSNRTRRTRRSFVGVIARSPKGTCAFMVMESLAIDGSPNCETQPAKLVVTPGTCKC